MPRYKRHAGNPAEDKTPRLQALLDDLDLPEFLHLLGVAVRTADTTEKTQQIVRNGVFFSLSEIEPDDLEAKHLGMKHIMTVRPRKWRVAGTNRWLAALHLAERAVIRVKSDLRVGLSKLEKDLRNAETGTKRPTA